MRTLAVVLSLTLVVSVAGCEGTANLNAADAVAVATAQANLAA